ncbi:MAG: tRNA adenosine(34) deaminase TadA [Coriobacteriales bacterium]|jgi:tRNA(adenine34) deaminase
MHTPDDEQFMRLALDEARSALDSGDVPVGAVVVCGGEVVSRGHNRREEENDPTAHAEVVAIREASRALGRWRLSDCTLYVTLEPCIMCAGAMLQARIARCVVGAIDPKAGALDSIYALGDDPRLNHSFPVTYGVLEDECSELLNGFFSKVRESR